MNKKFTNILMNSLMYLGTFALLFAFTNLFVMIGWDISALAEHEPPLSFVGAMGPTTILLLILVLCRIFFKDVK